MTPRRPSWPGSARSLSSPNTSALERVRDLEEERAAGHLDVGRRGRVRVLLLVPEEENRLPVQLVGEQRGDVDLLVLRRQRRHGSVQVEVAAGRRALADQPQEAPAVEGVNTAEALHLRGEEAGGGARVLDVEPSLAREDVELDVVARPNRRVEVDGPSVARAGALEVDVLPVVAVDRDARQPVPGARLHGVEEPAARKDLALARQRIDGADVAVVDPETQERVGEPVDS